MARILMLAKDKEIREIIVYCVPSHAVTIVESAEEVPDELARGRYDLVIVTNFGVGPRAAVQAVPADRWPVLFLTGFMDAGIERDCLEKRIHYRMMPIEIPSLREELRLALDEVLL